MQNDKPNGHIAAQAAVEDELSFARPPIADEQPKLHPAVRCPSQSAVERAATPQPVLEHVHPSRLLPVLNDLRDREAPDYLDFFHNRLVPDIRERGVQMPLIAYWDGEMARLVDGMTRYLAALMAAVQAVPVLVYAHKPDDKALPLASLLANSLRRDMTPLELAGVYQELTRLNGWSQAELARHARVSPAHVAKVLAISTKLCPEARELVAAGKLSPRAAYALTRLPEQQQANLARKAVDFPLAVESVEEAVSKLLDNGRKPKAKPLKLRFDGICMTVINPTTDGLQAFFERGLAAVKKLGKDGDGPEFLPARMKGA